MNKKLAALLLTGALTLLSGCGTRQTVDPHEGMINVNTGGNTEWLYPADGVAVSDFAPADFALDESGRVTYTGADYAAETGIDVSFYQGDIDWQAVRDSGVTFAMIRCGFRGSSQGGIFDDEKFTANMEGAIAAGLKVGVYFFSQSTGAKEAAEEALYVLDKIKDYQVTMPVAFDWEPLDDSRAQDINVDELTSAAAVFCEIVKDAGYEPCVYFYRYLAYHDYDLSALGGYTFWVGAPGDVPDFYYAHSIWQYSFTGAVPGITGDVDLNLHFTRLTETTSTPAPSA
jgi:lysozyme